MMVYALLLLGVHAAKAQAPPYILRGIVHDSSTGQLLEDATVSLLQNQSLLFQTRSGKNGFLFRRLHSGTYWLLTTCLGYRPDTTEIRLDSTDKNIRVLLHPSAKALMQVVVTARIPPAIVRSDTIAFNAGAYPTRPNATIEDLLRKLPGVDIDKDGNVTMQGKKIDKIYLDGKEFFLGDPRIASQNLPADIVDQIEAFDSQSDRSKLTGIKEMSKTKSINIKLKKNRRRGYFGKVYAGLGEGNSSTAYSAGGTATRLGASRVFGVGNVNNINNQFTGQDNRNGPGGGGIQKINNLELDYSNNGDGPGARPFNFTMNAGTNGSHATLNQSTSTQTALTDSSLLQYQATHSTSSNQSTHGNAFLEYKIDTTSLIEWRSNGSSNQAKNSSTDTVSVATLQPQATAAAPLNHGRTINSGQTTSWNWTSDINYRWKGHQPGQSLVINAAQSTSTTNSPQTTFSLVSNLDSAGNVTSQTLIHEAINTQSAANTYHAGATYIQTLWRGHVLDFNYNFSITKSRSDQTANDYDSATGRFDHPDSGSTNHFTTTNSIQRMSAGYNATVGKIRYQIGATFQLSDLSNLDRSTDSNIRIRQSNWYPRASVLYTPAPGTSVNFQYSANTITPSVQQLQPVADPTNPFLVKVGNPNLQQALIHNAGLNFNSFNGHNFQNWQAELHGNLTQNAITTSTTLLSGGIQQIEYVNTDGTWDAGGSLSYGFPLGNQRKGNGSLGLNGQYGRNTTIVNDVTNITGTIQGGATAKLNLHPTEQLFIEAQGNLNYGGSRYEPNTTQPVTTWAQTWSVDAAYTLPAAITVSSWFHYQRVSGTLPVVQSNQWNASVAKDLGRTHSSQLRLSAYGLLNTAQNTSQTTSANVTSVTTANLPGRTLLLSFTYHFRHFNTTKSG